MSDRYAYANRHPKYKDFTEEEWKIKNSFTYDEQKSINDVKIIDMQNNYRYGYMHENFGVHPDSP